MVHDEPLLAAPAADLPSFAEDGTDLTLIRHALELSPVDRLREFESFMADVVQMFDAANRP